MKTLTKSEINLLLENKIKKSKKSNLILENYTKSYSTWIKSSTSKDEKFIIADRAIKTSKKLINEGHDPVLVEGWMSDMLMKAFGGSMQTLKEYITRYLLNALNFKNSTLREVIVKGIANMDFSKNWRKIISPVQNCEFIVDWMVDTVIEHYLRSKIEKFFDSAGGVFASISGNALADALLNQESVQKFQNALYEPVCGLLRKGFAPINSKIEDIKKSGGVFGGGDKSNPSPTPATA